VSGPVDGGRRRLLGLATAFAAAGTGLVSTAAVQREPRLFAALSRPTAWLDSPPLSVSALLDRPVLLQFGTYTCINWLRTLPYVRAWYRRYGQRMTVLVVHSPEFTFERDIENVRRALHGMRLGFPVAVDSEHVIWRAFGNRYWPALYLLEEGGRIRHAHFGEGDYERTEQAIRTLLGDTGGGPEDTDLVRVAASGIELQPDWRSMKSPELYLGSRRAAHFASPGGATPDRPRDYAAPARLSLNAWALAGNWTIAGEPAVLNQAPGRIVCRFHARDAHLVMGSIGPGLPGRIRVTLDGRAPGPAHGGDIDGNGNGNVAEPRLYQLIRQPGPIADRLLEIEFLDYGAEAFAFTFG
jgi:hypothetical protein